ncbi:2Fe-2S iron-sulfur cluster-binding protein [Azohydromonas caseinilytica]|uniref:2Fe-2S iron-sulfur cluster binding domain-containing protein n=1 Tax=Azohydromonas caseinilytica TaxID=2728836 RepID=A0A848FGN6_9BURK|nr:2Fe-2S iron-sulfur cluster binding domain-containing protein [Azohydromonas caseinilytica]NML18015.1 2Fe-2S iron-sulfur cluster binding domain-containing protein [Azohydromonas caseinilytica]
MNTVANAFTLTVTIDGVAHVGAASPERTLLENIEALRLPIRSACRRGRCGACRVTLLEGRLHPELQLLRDGQVLSCSSRLDGDAHVEVPRRPVPAVAPPACAAQPVPSS